MSDYILWLKTVASYPWWQYQLGDNTLLAYSQAFLVFIVLFFAFWIFQSSILRRLARFSATTKTDLDDTLVAIIKTLRPPFYSFLSLYLALFLLHLPTFVWPVLNAVLIVWLVWQAVTAGDLLVNFIVHRALAGESEGDTKTAAQSLSLITKVVLWSLGLLMILSNLGIEITSLLAGLGIGGVAVALAVQNILGDLFSSFALYFDRPFKVGDFIIVGADMGVVERIGIKTTRLRALQGEEIVISNRELTSVRVQNFKKMAERRVAFNFGVTYETPNDKLLQIPDLLQTIIKNLPDARFDRANLQSFGDSALVYEVVYYVTTGDYNRYMAIQETINLDLKAALEKLSVSFAYPTQTVYLAK